MSAQPHRNAFAARAWLLALVVALGLGASAHAQTPGCTQFYLAKTAPTSAPHAVAPSGREFCHSEYVSFYSTSLRDPLWSAEYLTRSMAGGGDKIGRVIMKFQPQDGLDASEEGDHHDYDHTGYDRGHMMPADDASSLETQSETFVVTNIVPQAKRLNEGLWQYLEASVHVLAEKEGAVYVVTGPIFSASPPLIANRIAIPDATFKAIYVPSKGIALAYVATNVDDTVCTVMSIADLMAKTSLDPFPSLEDQVKSAKPQLALPHGVHYRQGEPVPVPLPKCR